MDDEIRRQEDKAVEDFYSRMELGRLEIYSFPNYMDEKRLLEKIRFKIYNNINFRGVIRIGKMTNVRRDLKFLPEGYHNFGADGRSTVVSPP